MAATLCVCAASASQEAVLRGLSEARRGRPSQRDNVAAQKVPARSPGFFFFSFKDRKAQLHRWAEKGTTPFPPADCPPTSVDSPPAHGKPRITWTESASLRSPSKG